MLWAGLETKATLCSSTTPSQHFDLRDISHLFYFLYLYKIIWPHLYYFTSPLILISCYLKLSGMVLDTVSLEAQHLAQWVAAHWLFSSWQLHEWVQPVSLKTISIPSICTIFVLELEGTLKTVWDASLMWLHRASKVPPTELVAEPGLPITTIHLHFYVWLGSVGTTTTTDFCTGLKDGALWVHIFFNCYCDQIPNRNHL